MPSDGLLRDALALAGLALFAWLGARRGGRASALALAALVLAWAAAAAAALHLGPLLAKGSGIPPLLAPPLAGTAAFFAVVGGLGALGRRLLLRPARRRDDAVRGLVDRLAGALFGTARGALFVVLIAWLGLWLDAARAPGSAAPASPPPSAVSRVAAAAVERGVGAVLGSDAPGARVASRVLAHPGTHLDRLRQVSDHPQLQRLAHDQPFWDHVEAGALDAAMSRASFGGIVHDDSLRRELVTLGLVGPQAEQDRAAFREEMRAVLAELGPRLKAVRNDPELAALAGDPEIRRLAEGGETLALLRHPRVRRLLARMLSTPEAP